MVQLSVNFALEVLTMPLPLPVLDQEEKCPNFSKSSPGVHWFKGKNINLSNRKLELSVPECIGEYLLFNYLEIPDICRIRSVSKQFKKFAETSLHNMESVIIYKRKGFVHSSLLSVLSLACSKQPVNNYSGAALKYLSVIECPRYDFLHTVDENFSNALSRLSVLKIRDCENLSESGLKLALSRCKNLVELDSDKVSDDVLQVVNVESNKNATFRNLNAHGSGKLLTDTGLLTLARILRFTAALTCTNTKNNGVGRFSLSINVKGCDITDEGLNSFSSILAGRENENPSPNLPRFSRLCSLKLNISHCSKLTSDEGMAESLEDLLTGPFIRLEGLKMFGITCTDQLLLKLAEYVGSGYGNIPMRSIEFGDCTGIKDANSLVALASSDDLSSNLRSLIMRRCIHTGTEGFGHLVSKCINLTQVDFSKCHRGICDRTLQLIGNSCKNLRVADFHSCTQITDAGVEGLVKGCTYLEDLNFGSCEKLSDQAVFWIAESTKSLKSLCLFCCHRITDDSIIVLAEKSLMLQCLDVSWCFRVNGGSLFKLAKTRSTFRELHIEGCSHISDLEVQNLIKVSSRLTSESLRRDNVVDGKVSTAKNSSVTFCGSPLCVNAMKVGVTNHQLLRSRSSLDVFTRRADTNQVNSGLNQGCTCDGNVHKNKIKQHAKSRSRRRTLIQSSSFLLSSSKSPNLSSSFTDQSSPSSFLTGDAKNFTLTRSNSLKTGMMMYQRKPSREICTPINEQKAISEQKVLEKISPVAFGSLDEEYSTPRRIWGENDQDIERLRAFSFSSEVGKNSPDLSVGSPIALSSLASDDDILFRLDDTL